MPKLTSYRGLILAGILVAAVITVIIGTLFGIDIAHDRRFKVEVVSPAPLYSLPPYEYPPSNPLIATLQPRQPLKVLRVRYGKDFETLKVETDDGKVGWVIDGEGVKVLGRGESKRTRLSDAVPTAMTTRPPLHD